MKENSNIKKYFKRIGIGLVVILVVVFSAFYIYTLDYYRADSTAENTKISQTIDDYYIFKPEDSVDRHIGFIFYPGGKVEALAYTPLMKKLADEGITCVLVKMPFNLAVFNIKAADDIVSGNNRINGLDNIKEWNIGGHSLGGAMASSYLANTKNKFDGLVLLGAYPINNFEIPILAIVGSEDKVVNQEKLKDIKAPLIIQGGNHGNYGNYGNQKGDGKSLINREEQQRITVEVILNFLIK